MTFIPPNEHHLKNRFFFVFNIFLSITISFCNSNSCTCRCSVPEDRKKNKKNTKKTEQTSTTTTTKTCGIDFIKITFIVASLCVASTNITLKTYLGMKFISISYYFFIFFFLHEYVVIYHTDCVIFLFYYIFCLFFLNCLLQIDKSRVDDDEDVAVDKCISVFYV